MFSIKTQVFSYPQCEKVAGFGGGGGLSIEVKLEKPVLEPASLTQKRLAAALSAWCALVSHVALSRHNKQGGGAADLKTNMFKHTEDKKYISSHPGVHLPLKVEVCVLFEVSSVLINISWFEHLSLIC